MRLLSRSIWTAALIAGVACSDSDDGMEPDAGLDAAAAAYREIEQLVSQAIDNYDRELIIRCTCTFDPPDNCIETGRSGPTWVSCSARVLAEHDSPELRASSQCMLDETEARIECLESTACGSEEQAACSEVATECGARDFDLVNQILTECPDTGLLSRLPQ